MYLNMQIFLLQLIAWANTIVRLKISPHFQYFNEANGQIGSEHKTNEAKTGSLSGLHIVSQ